MAFDDELDRTLDTFTKSLRDEVTNRLRDEVARQVRDAVDEAQAAARADRETATREAREASELAVREAVERVERVASERAEREANERADREAKELASREAAGPSASAGGSSPGHLAEGIRALGEARSLSEVLDTLVGSAAHEAARAGVLLVRGERFHGWRFLGFEPALDTGDPLDIARDYAGVVARAAGSGALASQEANSRDAAPVFAQLPPGRPCVAVPIAFGGQVVAVLYADAGTRSPEPGTKNPEPGTLNLEPLEILALFASQRLEALTALKVARSLTVNANPSSAAADRSDESADQHAAARRYARLLVSEIKLYHEPQVAEGRRERDLTTRLGGEIARVRALYEQRVPAEIRKSTDYVHEELIRTLADGDASLLEAKRSNEAKT